MEREIIFRGKRTDKGEWVEGSLVQMLVDGRIASCIAPIEEVGRANKDVPPMGILYTLNKDIFIVHPDTIGQYTGMIDKNGNKIFEGDIVDCWSQGRHCTNGIVTWMENRIFITIKGKDGHVVDNWHIMPNNNGIDEGLSVIGNIYDNPELTKGESK